jgi:imidazoleglycerol-phosphate dehydratase
MEPIKINRKTSETDIKLTIDFDASYSASLDTELGFLNHMLNTFAKYCDIDIQLIATGDLHVDPHHLVEDIAIVLGKAIRKRIDENTKIKRFGYTILPMDDSLILLSLDLSGRSYLNYDVSINKPFIGGIEEELYKEFFMKLTNNTMMNLHIQQLAGENGHHIIENIFKALGLCLRDALQTTEDVLSTKGTIGG